jgi:hypothetical protein
MSLCLVMSVYWIVYIFVFFNCSLIDDRSLFGLYFNKNYLLTYLLISFSKLYLSTVSVTRIWSWFDYSPLISCMSTDREILVSLKRNAIEEITVLYLKISRHQLEIWWSQIKFTGDALAESVNGYLRPLNPQLMPWNFQIQYSYLHCNVIMCIDVYCHIIDKMT